MTSLPLLPRPASTAAALLLLAQASPAQAAESRLNGHTFTHPDGFTIELAAGNQLVPRPIAGSFDPEGRLYVTDSSGLNLPPAEQLKDPKSRILRLADTDGDGRFDTASVFADRVMFPQGCLWHAGSVYVAGPPSIWKFTDTDGDGVADKREEWYRGQVLTGCANDVHGPYLGPEGMLYWTKGAFERLALKDGRGQPIQDRCAHVFRARPDGSGMESVMSGGMDNPVEVAFTPDGEPIFISTFLDLSQPGRRDGLGHAAYGSVFGKANGVLDDPIVKRTGDLMPVLAQFGPAAACALTRYDGTAFGADYRHNLFATLFNLRKVTRHVLRREGASYATTDSDFLASDQIDFRPTDVFEDVDGSLLVVDTGGWYKLCCPSSQLAKADVLGGIYRVRRTGTQPLSRDRRAGAYARLTRPPESTASPVSDLKRAATEARPESTARFLGVLARLTPASARDAETATQARLAAEGLGRLRATTAVPTLFTALGNTSAVSDRFLEHALLYALLEIADAPATRPFLASKDPVQQRAALLVLEQIPASPALTPDDLVPHLNASHAALRDTARWVVRRHPDWSPRLASHLRTRLADAATPADEKRGWEDLLGMFASQPDTQAFLAEVATGRDYRTESQVAALNAMGASGAKATPAPWREAILATLTRDDAPDAVRLAALRGSRALALAKEEPARLTAALHPLSTASSQPLATRIEALASLPQGTAIEDPALQAVLQALEPGRPPTLRLAAAGAIGRLRLTTPQLISLTPALAAAGPLELPRLLNAFDPGGDDALGRRLVAALKSSPGLPALRPDDALPRLAKFPDATRAEITALLAAQRSTTEQDRARLDALLGEIQKLKGDIRSGQALFNSPKAACASCHRLGYLGGEVGPDLTSIGQARTERDLLEAVVYPSTSFVRSYEPWIATTVDGEEYSGVLRSDSQDEIVLATGPGAETRIRRANLKELRLGALSTMPAGLDQQLSHQDLADLVAFLKNTKWGAN